MEDSSIFNTFGQVYFNPVGFYTDGMCYSTCETFAAHIQDHGIGTVFGEDETTGGSGADVLSSDDDDFTNRPLEYIADPFTKGSQGKTLAKNSIPESPSVFVNWSEVANTGVSAYDRIADYLNDVAKRKVDSKIYFISEPYDRVTFDDSMNIPFVASGVDEVTVVYQEQKGWNFNDGKWIIGDGVSDYCGHMSSTVRLWLFAPVGSTIGISLDGIVNTYEDGWYFGLTVMDDSGEIVPMVSSTSEDESTQSKSITGRSRVIDETHSFTVTTEEFSLNMNFVSYGTNSPFSVKLNSIVITKD
ncbi:hypothetical protein BASA83_005952 [Batrachochytrium salamandrivorans]|nr:hypothetical protein BASA83_005952 [Batrachochytrium salamandrivorans]